MEASKETPNLLKIGIEYNRNRLLAGQTPCELFKGMNDGKSVEELYLIAVRGLAACLNDPMLVPAAEKFLQKK